ncbi:MFS transporter [Siccirubricoccus sp. KC 17139]|uniref:MFS transporter n=1 Tax=Siccirubricoccus soli TaxID=2899147 RepID=A0ABT1D6W4_9PROT|nr:MFS transporter [Siccirubricoccus soli]MCO6416730.1 MFS transporter [Siccirubricoccus soli]MCP2682865.1 MFS transporter [Siccirubricoccus soli]
MSAIVQGAAHGIRHRFLRIVLPFVGMSFLNQAARSVVATVGPAMALEFGLSASGLGALAAVFFFAYAATQLPVGLAIDLWGPRHVQAALALVAALGFALCALAPDPFVLGIARFVTGIGIAGALIGVIKANVQWYPPARVAAVTGAGVFLGAAGGLAATVPVQWALPFFGWRNVFLLLALLSALVSAWILLSVPNRAPGAKPAQRRRLAVEIGEFGRIFRHPVFVRNMPAMALLSGLVFTYQGLWAGPWLRDVGGLGDLPRAQVLLTYALGMMFGQLLGGQVASWLQARGRNPMAVPLFGLGAMMLLQALLIAGPRSLPALHLMWFLFACVGSCGPVAYAALAQRFPPELTGRVATALNGSMLALVFLLQNLIGWILDLWPRTAAGGWDPAGYGWALGITLAGQVLTVLWLLRGR